MTREQQEEQRLWAVLDRRGIKYSRYAYSVMQKYFKKIASNLVTLVDNVGLDEASARIAELFDDDDLLLVYITMYTTIGQSSFIQSYDALKRSLGSIIDTPTLANALWIQKLKDLTRSAEVVKRTTSVIETSKQRILKVLNEAKKLNLPKSRLSRFIRKNLLGEHSASRSKLIAEIESRFVSAMAEEESAIYVSRELNVTLEKKWVRLWDDALRDGHRYVTTAYIPAESKFNVGGYMAKFPFDPVLPINLVANCRCKCHYRKKDGGFI